MDVSGSGVAQRLNRAIPLRGLTKASFQQEMEKRKAPTSSVPAVYRYLRGDGATPSIEFLAEAAALLDVRFEWLAAGAGEMTEAEERDAQRWKYAGEFYDVDSDLAFRNLTEADQLKHARKRRSIARFSEKLDDANISLEKDEREALLKSALKWLIRVDEVFEEVTRAKANESDALATRTGLDPFILRTSSSSGWRVMWEEDVLTLFARRVVGLGERSNAFWDAHNPAAGRGDLDYSNV